MSKASAKVPQAEQKPTHSSISTRRGKAPSKTDARATTARKSTSPPPKTIRPGSKLEIIVKLLKRPKGCTAADILDATGWPAVSVPQQARAAGLELRQEKDGKVTRYWAI